jgi:hypothetical protein
MTAPAAARERFNNDGPRIYEWPHPSSGLPAEFDVVSVTSATGCFPKPWLTGWAVKMTAERAVDKYRRLGEMIEEDGEKEALAWLKKARFTSSGDKADRGTIVHSALEAYVAGVTPTRESLQEALTAKRVPRALHRGAFGMVDGLMKFFDDFEPEVIWSEQSVYSRQHGYAGTTDLIGRMHVAGARRPVVIDVKCSKAIYDETAMQLAGYARADFAGVRETGEELPILPDGERIEYGVVVRPTAAGDYEHAVFELNDDVFDCFLACLRLATGAAVLTESKQAAVAPAPRARRTTRRKPPAKKA